MKRKALITSTALLLVAIVCLATASYAWFTAGSTAKISTFELSISQNDSTIQLAPANATASYAKGLYQNTLSTASWSTNWAKFPDALTPVSTTDAKAFFATDYSETTNYWTAKAAGESDTYVLFSFWVKSTVADNDGITVTVTSPDNATFKSAVKLAYNVSDSAAVGDMTIKDLATDAVAYQTVSNVTAPITAICEKVTDDAAVQDTKFAAVTGTGFENNTGFTDYTQSALGNIDLGNFTAGQEKLVTVAIWLEGMDSDCQGTGYATLTGNAFGFAVA